MDETKELRKALLFATAHLIAVVSAYERYASRHRSVKPRSRTDPFYTTRMGDFRKAVDAAEKALVDLKIRA